jgi:arginyl-tRNA synthetase
MVEYTDPNPFKEMHIGHLMSNVIGEALSRLIANEGAHVIRACYQGDVGPHVAKALWGLQQKGITTPTTAAELGDAYAAGSRAYEADDKSKAEIDALNQKIYSESDPALMELWRLGRQMSLDAFEELYRRLGTHFDYYFFESETAEPGMRIVRDGVEKGIFEESEGAVVYKGEKKGLHTLVFITSRGTPTYEAKELGLAFLKEERAQFDESIIVTAAEQIGHFTVFSAALAEIAPLLAEKTRHIPHGFLRLTTGKMSSREGNVVTAEGLIREMIAKAGEKNADPLIAEQVALGAIKFMILRQSPGQDIVFDEEKSLSLEGDSGPYLQYALVRARSVLAKADARECAHETPPESYRLERLLLHYLAVARRAADSLAPNLLVTYLLELAGEWNSFYAREQIIGGEYEAYKLLIARAFAQTMTNGLTLLGIPTPEKM